MVHIYSTLNVLGYEVLSTIQSNSEAPVVEKQPKQGVNNK